MTFTVVKSKKYSALLNIFVPLQRQFLNHDYILFLISNHDYENQNEKSVSNKWLYPTLNRINVKK